MENRIYKWLEVIDRNEIVPNEITALNIGFFETPDGYSLYLIGAAGYDADNDDWACDEDYEPAEKYLPMAKEIVGNMDWEEFQEMAIAEISRFLKDHSKSKAFNRIITAGFDDGELIRLK